MTRAIKLLLLICLIPCAAYALLIIGVFLAGLGWGVYSVTYDEPCERTPSGYCTDGRP